MSDSKDALNEKFEQFSMTMHDSLDALKKYIANLPTPERISLDYSFESLDSLESVLEMVLDKKVSLDTTIDVFFTRVATYMGETFRKQVGGYWVMAENPKDINYGLPCLTEIPGLPEDFEWCPLQVVDNFKYRRQKGLLRGATEANIIRN